MNLWDILRDIKSPAQNHDPDFALAWLWVFFLVFLMLCETLPAILKVCQISSFCIPEYPGEAVRFPAYGDAARFFVAG